MNLRPLDKSKIIDPKNPSFKFKANSSIERVLETINNRTASLDETQSRNISMKKLKIKRNLNNSVNTECISPKELYPNLHEKTHFKAVYEMFVTPSLG